MTNSALKDEKDVNGWSPFSHAVMNAHKGVVRYLADHQADKEVKDEKGQMLFCRVVKVLES